MIVELELPGLPKSLNRVGSRGSHFAFHREKKAWEGMIVIALLEEKVPKNVDRVEAGATLYPPTAHRRDEGNYRTMLEKCLGDALQLGWLPDDDPGHFQFKELTFGEKRPKPGLTVIKLYLTYPE